MRTALNVIDPFANAGMAGSIDFFGYSETLGAVGTMERVNNQVTYILPSGLGGLNGSAAYVFGEAAGGTKPDSAWAFNVGYGNGPVAVQVAYSQQNGNPNGKLNDLIAGGTYDLGFLKLHAGYHKTEGKDGAGATTTDNNAYLVGLTVPLGDSLKLRGWYIKNSEDAATNADSQAAALSLTYALSKRTQLYTTAVFVDNDSTSTKAPIDNVAAGNAGANGRTIAFGVQHNF